MQSMAVFTTSFARSTSPALSGSGAANSVANTCGGTSARSWQRCTHSGLASQMKCPLSCRRGLATCSGTRGTTGRGLVAVIATVDSAVGLRSSSPAITGAAGGVQVIQCRVLGPCCNLQPCRGHFRALQLVLHLKSLHATLWPAQAKDSAVAIGREGARREAQTCLIDEMVDGGSRQGRHGITVCGLVSGPACSHSVADRSGDDIERADGMMHHAHDELLGARRKLRLQSFTGGQTLVNPCSRRCRAQSAPEALPGAYRGLRRKLVARRNRSAVLRVHAALGSSFLITFKCAWCVVLPKAPGSGKGGKAVLTTAFSIRS